MNKRIILSVAFIVVGNFFIMNSASANYGYQHNSKQNYKLDNSKNRYHGDRTGIDSQYEQFGPESRCFNYRVTVAGGRGGFRFQHNKKDFKRINDSDYTGRICGYKNASFELSKLDPSAYISIEINGQHFEYEPNSKPDKYINHWHRKYFSVNLKYRYD